MAFEFGDTILFARPTKFYYKFVLFEERENTRRPKNEVIRTIVGSFDNYDLSDSKLKYCIDSNNNYQYFTYFTVDSRKRYEARLTCSVEDGYKKLFYP